MRLRLYNNSTTVGRLIKNESTKYNTLFGIESFCIDVYAFKWNNKENNQKCARFLHSHATTTMALSHEFQFRLYIFEMNNEAKLSLKEKKNSILFMKKNPF